MTDFELTYYYRFEDIIAKLDPTNLKFKEKKTDEMVECFCKTMKKQIRKSIPKGKHIKPLEICLKKIDKFIKAYRGYNPLKKTQVLSEDKRDYYRAFKELFSGTDLEILSKCYERLAKKNQIEYESEKPIQAENIVDQDYSIPSDVEHGYYQTTDDSQDGTPLNTETYTDGDNSEYTGVFEEYYHRTREK